MLCFLPPSAAAPRRGSPPPQRGTALGVVLAIILAAVGLLLPWLRPGAPRSTPEIPQARIAPAGFER